MEQSMHTNTSSQQELVSLKSEVESSRKLLEDSQQKMQNVHSNGSRNGSSRKETLKNKLKNRKALAALAALIVVFGSYQLFNNNEQKNVLSARIQPHITQEGNIVPPVYANAQTVDAQ